MSGHRDHKKKRDPRTSTSGKQAALDVLVEQLIHRKRTEAKKVRAVDVKAGNIVLLNW